MMLWQRGFNLDRGNIGANVEHKTKLEFQIEENKAELELLNQEKENTLKVIENSKNALIESNKAINKDILNPKKTIVGYNSNDVQKIVEYSKGLEQVNIFQQSEIKNKDLTIMKLSKENTSFKNNEEIIKRDKIITEQKATIKEQSKEINKLKGIVNILNNSIDNLKEKLEVEVNKWKKLFKKICKAIDRLLDREPKDYVEDYENLADAINYDYYDYDNRKAKDKDKDDYEIGL